MRDLLLAALLFAALPVAVARPFAGALIFAWLSLMNPHRFTFGIAYTMPWAMLYALATMLGIAFNGRAELLDSLRRYWPVALYMVWMTVTTINAVDSVGAARRYSEVFKIHVMCLLTLSLLTSRQRILALAALLVASVGFFGVKGGVFTILSGGSSLVWGPPDTPIEDNNHLAAGLVIILPLFFWAITMVKRRVLKMGLVGCALLVAISVLGSHSRGAFLALGAMSMILILKSNHKLLAGAAIVAVALIATTLMPADYWSRMDTIQTYEEDASAMGRVNTWWTAYNVANARLTGAGYEYYGSWLYKAHAPNPEAVHSSHSIYFQSLGEHGWIGFALFMTFLLTFWRNCSRFIKVVPATEEARQDQTLARMLQCSLVGLIVAGAFVNIGNWDALYYAFIIALALNRIRQREATQQSAATRPMRDKWGVLVLPGAAPPGQLHSQPLQRNKWEPDK